MLFNIYIYFTDFISESKSDASPESPEMSNDTAAGSSHSQTIHSPPSAALQDTFSPSLLKRKIISDTSMIGPRTKAPTPSTLSSILQAPLPNQQTPRGN